MNSRQAYQQVQQFPAHNTSRHPTCQMADQRTKQQPPVTHLADKVLRPVVALQREKVAAAKEAVIGAAGAASGCRAKAAC